MLRKRVDYMILLLLLAVLVFATGCLSGKNNSLPPTEKPFLIGGNPIPPTSNYTPLPPTPTAVLPFVQARVIPSRGDLLPQLAAEVQKAYTLGYTPVVEFDAT